MSNDDIRKLVEIGAINLELAFSREGKPKSDWPVWRIIEVLGRKRNPRPGMLMQSVTEYGIVSAASMGITVYCHANWVAWADGTRDNPFMSLRHLVLSVAEARDDCLKSMKANRVRSNGK